jgi:hypothetical protein
MAEKTLRGALVECIDFNALALSPDSEVNGIPDAGCGYAFAVPILLELVGVIVQAEANWARAEQSRFSPAANEFLEHGLPPADAMSAGGSTPAVMLSCPVRNRRPIAGYGFRQVSALSITARTA